MLELSKYPQITKISISDTTIILNLVNAFRNLKNLTECIIPLEGSNSIIDMSNAYHNCTNLTGSPICG